MDLTTIRAVITDMDGVLWNEDEALPGLVELFALLRSRQIPIVAATNNATKTPVEYVSKFARMGVQGVQASEIITSGTAITTYIQERYAVGTRIHVLGSAALRTVLEAAGFPSADDAVAVVIVGLDKELTYNKLKQASLLIQAGAEFIGTNDDPALPSPEGLIPGAGSVVAAVTVASGKRPSTLIGKPHPPLFEAALRYLGTQPQETLMIGDRLDTDILGAQKLGIKTALVLTGASTHAHIDAGSVQPDGIYANLPSLIAAWNAR
jgi:4-nitrophenyl phosphatase